MPDDVDARVLLAVAPDQYVAERTRLVKQARADKDRRLATFYQALKRPSIGLWAALVAGADAAGVDKVVAVTTELAGTQAGGVDASSLNAATKARRKELEAFVDRAVKALAKFDDGAEKRRPEIRGIVDQLSRHPDLVERWVDGSLRVLPDDEFGFGSFAGMEVTTASQPKPQPQPETKPEPKSRSKAVRPPAAAKQTVSKADRAAERAAERQARAAHAERARKARHAVAVAARALSTADRELDTARSALRQAEAAVQLAEEARRDAEQRHETARLAASHLADSN